MGYKSKYFNPNNCAVVKQSKIFNLPALNTINREKDLFYVLPFLGTVPSTITAGDTRMRVMISFSPICGPGDLSSATHIPGYNGEGRIMR